MTAQTEPVMSQTDVIATSDPQVAELIRLEQQRQELTLELIASENHTSPAVMAASVPIAMPAAALFTAL